MERLLDYFVPEKYILDISVNKEQKEISGKVVILGRAEAENIKFHAVGIEVEGVLVNGKKWDFETRDGLLTVLGVPRSDLRVEVGYHGSLNENMEGAYLSTYEYQGRTERIVATQFESHYAREAFPCIDEPAAKAVFELSITADKEDLVLANTPEAKREGLKRIFAPTPRMSTYLLAFVIGKFQGKTVVNKHGTEITTYCALNQDIDSVDFANEVAARSLEFYDDNFGVSYPLAKLTQVALPDFEAGAMENWGLVTYRETMLLSGKTATLSTKKSVALTVAHELSHQWFGDLVTMKWWDDLWLNESFATVMEYMAVDAIYPEFKIWEGFFTGDALAALRRDCLTGVQAVHQDVEDPAEIATLFDPAIVYAKGARLMLMLIRLMGWEKFTKGLRDYFTEYAYQNTVGDDLWGSLEKYADFNVFKLMHAYIDQPGYPVITGVKKAEGTSEYFALPATEFAEIEQKRFLIDGGLEPSDWPILEVKEDMSWHYILNLSEEELSNRLSKFDQLGLEEKLRLLIDRDLVSKTELAASSSLLPLIAQFKEEGSAAVWNILLTIISGLKIFFEPDSPEETAYRKFIGELVRPKLAEIGAKTREGDDENTIRLRGILLGLEFFAEDYEGSDFRVIRELAELYRDDLTEIDPEIRSDVLDAKIYLSPEMLPKYLEMYKGKDDPEIKFDLLFSLTMVKNKKALTEVKGLLNQPEVVKPQDQFYLFLYLLRNRRMRLEMLDWLEENWEYVREMGGDKTLENYPRYSAASIRTADEYQRWMEVFSPLEDDLVLKRAIEVGKNEIMARIRLISQDAESVKQKLKNVI